MSAMFVVLTVANLGPINICVNQRNVFLNDKNLSLIASIIDPLGGVKLLERCLLRMSNQRGHCPS